MRTRTRHHTDPRRATLHVRTAALALLALIAALLPAIQAAPAAAAGTNLALGKAVSVSSTNGQYVAADLNDGSQDTYWESTNGTFPQWAQIDLGATTSVNQVVLKLPASWGARTETLTVQGSTDNSTFSTIVA